MAERGYRNLNTSVLKQITKTLEHDPAADLEAVLKKVYTSYANFRQRAETRQKKRGIAVETHDEFDQDLSLPKKPRTIGALLPFTSPLQPQQPTCQLSPGSLPLAPSVSFSCVPCDIISPLSPTVCNLLGLTDGCSTDLSSIIIRSASSSKSIWENSSRAVIQISQDVVVKVAQTLDEHEHGVLQFLEERLPTIPVPRALGLVKVGNTFFMFMTLVPGTTLETRWSSLSAEAKTQIRHALDKHFSALRELELPCGSPLGSPAGHHVCKDVRRHDRVSPCPVYSEAEFNDFLLHSPSSRAAQGYRAWLRSMLRTDHRILFTHADLHPRNIMVVEGVDGSVELSGIIDWEFSGYYPEYWEYLKAMNTRSIKDTSDWWDYLPPSILGYDHNLVLDRIIESSVVY